MLDLRALGAAAVLLASLAPAEVLAQPKGTTTVNLNYPGLSLRFTLPQGYCPATGQYDAFAKQAFQSEPDQLLLLVAFRCEAMAAKQSPQESFTIKTSRKTLRMDAGDRASFLKSGAPTNAGRDEFGQYMASEEAGKVGNVVVNKVQSGAITAIKHRLIVLNYSSASLIKSKDKASALKFIKEQTRRLVEQNP
jgi:hypothetical protein